MLWKKSEKTARPVALSEEGVFCGKTLTKSNKCCILNSNKSSIEEMFDGKVRFIGPDDRYTEVIKGKEGLVMETTFYTFSANEIVVTGDGVEQVSGGEGRRLVCVRRGAADGAQVRPVRGKVISMEAWRAAHVANEEDWADETEDWMESEGSIERQGENWSPRARTDHSRERSGYLELLACIALIAVSAAACAAFLL